ncbi:peptidase M61 [Cellulophaga baltica]|uniref:M61 family metallopeptidase n=1 Tax=Cellulophaga TaxID=104264 RepID=UPI001C0722CB|nr:MULTISPECIES: peptidase M61 [Cellulophaga]MBU2997221.1 peptidase M61 [Cellulophaga baltica]MDO6768619.1 peptidase M61 [Cellulophaga sp. 1_MG-2023]
MKKISFLLVLGLLLNACAGGKKLISADKALIKANIDLVNVNEDKVLVSVDPGAFSEQTVYFYIPKTVPGTYSTDNYGKYIESFKAFDYKGKELSTSKIDDNTWEISNGASLDKVSYFVNDTYDSESTIGDPVFSPSGTNILKGRNFMLNLHGFVGYFKNLTEVPYEISINHPENLVATTSLNKINETKTSKSLDTFLASRYFQVTDNPILYAPADIVSFEVNGITVNLSVYSPNKTYTAASLKDRMYKMMAAQKSFLGAINSTKEYNIILYLSEGEDDAGGYGALEHHTSTVVVLPEFMDRGRLEQAMVDVVSHEFFHIVTPLSVHSEEVQFFDFNDPKMSMHLWMYEGTTEYFANIFQIQQGLINEEEFYQRIMDKINNSKRYDDTMSFTEMSKHILEDGFKDNYANVYEKGTLINMALDITLRDLSNGEKSVLWLLKELSKKYGDSTPFKDDLFIDEVVAMTYPEIGEFFETHVIGDTPIDYEIYLQKVGLVIGTKEEESGFFLKGEVPYIDVDPQNDNAIFIRKGVILNSFFENLGAKAGDVIKSIDGALINLESMRSVIGQSFSWPSTKKIIMVVDRAGERLTLQGEVGKPTVQSKVIKPVANPTKSQLDLLHIWTKG